MTKLFIFLLVLLACAEPALASGAAIDTQLIRDRAVAVKAINPELAGACLADFSERNQASQSATPLGALQFSDHITRIVHRVLYWNHSDRGVAFLMPIATDNQPATNIACLYSVTDEGLEFQLSQRVGG